MLMLSFFKILIVISFGEIIASYKIIAINRNEYLAKPNNIRIKYISNKNQERNLIYKYPFVSPLFLIKKESSNVHQDHSNVNLDFTFRSALRAKIPVIYSDGRYTLDLDKINLKDVKLANNKQEKETGIESFEDFKDYYDYLEKTKRLRTFGNDKTIMGRLKPSKLNKDKNSFRKLNPIIRQGKHKYNHKRNEKLKNIIRKKKRFFLKKRFHIVSNNDQKKNNHKIYNTVVNKPRHNSNEDENSVIYITSNNDILQLDKKLKTKKDRKLSTHIFDKVSEKEKKKKKKYKNGFELDTKKKKEKIEFSSASEDYLDEDMYYLQSNVLAEPRPKKGTKFMANISEENFDKRRRLQYFMPKRYHWTPDQIHKLGYFWFNGPKGKYPDQVPID